MAKDVNEILEELKEELKYATLVLGTGREALIESKIGKGFDGKPPKLVTMHALSHSLAACDLPNLERDKFIRGLIALCVFYLEDEDVSLALKLKEELDKEQ